MSFTKQRGGTFIGLIVGLVLGLAVALSVAVFVTKVPVPFIHTDSSRMPIQNAAEAARNQDWNPNAGLHGSGTVTPMPQAETPGAQAAAGDAPGAPQTAINDTGRADDTAALTSAARTEPVRPAPALDEDPLATVIAARTNPPAVQQNVDAFIYFVQAGAFSSVPDADAQRARLSLIGVQARVTQGGAAGRSVYRVRAGPFSDPSTARRVQAQLADNGFDAALVRVQR